ncbi:MAG: hypothetical protein Q4Q24_06315 [Methanobrevibacter ruminantium]|uniref:hypothetical protein n=1 Tax=Methanobrevibacter ruminantium TaxID=83816 RepID=UPI0026EE41AC|nr:hypothetical protein [Methanobrevibacter ruminantium]MDO5842859.1 hypothetical protein [Methanobrevibacter ruminantium]
MVNEITAELNDEQFERYQIMQENELSIGEAIDLIFYLRDHYGVRNDQLLEERLEQLILRKSELESEMENSDKDLSSDLSKIAAEMDILEKLKDTTYDFEAKEEILEKEYAAIDETYEMKVQAHKRGIKWGKFFNSIL